MAQDQTTLDLLDKIRQCASAEYIGPLPLSLQACRFYLPFDLKLLEQLTPLQYLSEYCWLSSRRHYQFRRLFDKYQNKFYLFDSSNLYLSLKDLHKDNLTLEYFNDLCRLIELNNESIQLTFTTYAGIIGLSERILYKYQNDEQIARDSIEICDFYSLDRKLDGLEISQAMRQLLNTIQKD